MFKANLNDWKAASLGGEPSINLKLDYVFGVETYHKNNTVLALSDPKRFLYFSGKIIVIYSPALNNQAFYRGHRYRVTSIALVPDK